MTLAALAVIVTAPAIGSFVGTVVQRFPRSESVIWGRSRCEACGTVLRVRDLVPLLSWIVQRGRCRYCGGVIGIFYPAIEIAALAVALWAVWVLDGWLLWASCGLGWTLLCLAMIDQRTGYLPDIMTLPLIPAGLAVTYSLDPELLMGHLAGALAGFAAFYAIAALYHRFRGRDGLGLGDAKLIAAAGAWVGWEGLPSVVLWACFTAFVMILTVRALGHQFTLKSSIAFGPYLCFGFWIVWLHGPFTLTW